MKRIGIQIRRRWVCAKDLRTRDAHGRADGQIVEADAPFEVGGEKLMFPGDTSLGASGWNIYNCRCGMRTVEKDGIEAEPREMRVRNPVTGKYELINEMTYQEWCDWKRAQDPAGFDLAKKKIQRESSDRKQHEEYMDVLGKKIPNSLDSFQNLKYTEPEKWELLKTEKKQTVFVNNAPCETTEKKFTGYFLKEGAKHSAEFFGVGYTSDNPLQLRYDIARQFNMENAVKRVVDASGSEKFNIYMQLGTEKKKRFRTCWKIDSPGEKPRIITAFREDE